MDSYGNGTKINGCRGRRQEGMNRQNMEHFEGSENTPHDSIMVYISHYTFVQTYIMYNTKSEP